MKKLLVLLATCAFATTAGAVDHYSDVLPGTPGNDPLPVVTEPATMQDRDLTYYNDQAAFEAAFPGLPVETFSATNVPPDGVEACEGPFNSMTNNLCFSPGAIQEGIQVHNLGVVPDDLNVVLTPFFLGVTDVVVGPNTFVTDAMITFDPPVAAVGMDWWCPFGPFNTTVTILDADNNELGNTLVPCGVGAGDFWGVSSDAAPIATIITVAGGSNGELFTNFQWGGGAPIPTEEMTWGRVKSLYGN